MKDMKNTKFGNNLAATEGGVFNVYYFNYSEVTTTVVKNC